MPIGGPSGLAFGAEDVELFRKRMLVLLARSSGIDVPHPADDQSPSLRLHTSPASSEGRVPSNNSSSSKRSAPAYSSPPSPLSPCPAASSTDEGRMVLRRRAAPKPTEEPEAKRRKGTGSSVSLPNQSGGASVQPSEPRRLTRQVTRNGKQHTNNSSDSSASASSSSSAQAPSVDDDSRQRKTTQSAVGRRSERLSQVGGR